VLNVSTVTSTPYADSMLFWRCGKGDGFYFAGQVGGSCRFETRRRNRTSYGDSDV
jgi:hypothetical protein